MQVEFNDFVLLILVPSDVISYQYKHFQKALCVGGFLVKDIAEISL